MTPRRIEIQKKCLALGFSIPDDKMNLWSDRAIENVTGWLKQVENDPRRLLHPPTMLKSATIETVPTSLKSKVYEFIRVQKRATICEIGNQMFGAPPTPKELGSLRRAIKGLKEIDAIQTIDYVEGVIAVYGTKKGSNRGNSTSSN